MARAAGKAVKTFSKPRNAKDVTSTFKRKVRVVGPLVYHALVPIFLAERQRLY